MKKLARILCSLVSFALFAAPSTQAFAQPQGPVNAACISYEALPAGVGITVKLPGDQEWRSVQHDSRKVILTSVEGGTSQVLIWKQLPQSEADRVSSNTLSFSIGMTPTRSPKTCSAGASNYRVQRGADGFTLISQGEPVRQGGTSRAAVALGAIVVVGLLAALFSGSSTPSGDSSSHADEERAAALEANARYYREAEARAEVERAIARRNAAEAWERLQRPNALGW